MKSYGPIGQRVKGGSTAQTQATNFKIGTGFRPAQQFQTTYGTVTGRSAGMTGSRVDLNDIKAKKTSILLGSANKNGFVTTNQRTFSTLGKHGKVSQVNKDFAHNIKASHFEYRHGNPPSELQMRNHYKSLATASFNHKGNAVQLKAKLDQAKKDDLRTNHFKIGGPSAAIKKSTS